MSKSLIERVEETAERRRAFVQEELILDTAEQIWELMKKKNIRKVRLSETLGRSAAYVTQLLNGSRNMTLRSLADVATALGGTVRIRIGEHVEHRHWCVDERQPLKVVKRLPTLPTIESCNEVSIGTIDTPRRYGLIAR